MVKLGIISKIIFILAVSVIIITILALNTSCKGEQTTRLSQANSIETTEEQAEKGTSKKEGEYLKEKESKAEEETQEVAEETTEFKETSESKEEVIQAEMKIESPSFKNNEMIPSKYTCDGENINPPLKISGVPKNAVSLVLIVDDPDAPGKTWIHWTVWNIDPKTKEIAENSVPEGVVEGMTDFGSPGYGGPCPPSGTHRYFFKLFALDITLSLNSSATVKDIYKAMEGHIISSAELVGLYSRK